MTTIDRSSYNQLINDIIGDVSEQEQREPISPEQFRNWINRAQQEICKRLVVLEQIEFEFTEDVLDYPVQDRPLITAATNADPSVITSASHGLASVDHINIRDVQGNDAVNGRRQVLVIGSSTFSTKEYADITGASDDVGEDIVITAVDHGFSTGDLVTITGVAGNTDANVTNNAITVVDVDSFSLDGVVGAGNEYTSGGVATVPVAGSGAYTYGGIYWKLSELPTFVTNIFGFRRAYETIYRPVTMVGELNLMTDQIVESELMIARSAYSKPVEATFISKNGQRYLHFMDRPDADGEAVLICRVEILPERYKTADLNSQIFLRSAYNSSIRSFVKGYFYERLGNLQKMGFHLSAFEKAVSTQKGLNSGPSRIRITYQ